MKAEQEQTERTEQLALDLSTIYIVRNHWGPVWHLCDGDHFTWPYTPEDEEEEFNEPSNDRPSSFPSIEAAQAYARARGVEPVLACRCSNAAPLHPPCKKTCLCGMST